MTGWLDGRRCSFSLLSCRPQQEFISLRLPRSTSCVSPDNNLSTLFSPRTRTDATWIVEEISFSFFFYPLSKGRGIDSSCDDIALFVGAVSELSLSCSAPFSELAAWNTCSEKSAYVASPVELRRERIDIYLRSLGPPCSLSLLNPSLFS